MAKTKPVTHTVSIVRDRGQLTIPGSIRALREWTGSNSVVTITSDKPDEIVIRPHKREVDWNKLWKQMKRVRSFKGKNKTSLSEFIAKDRESHF